MGASWNSMKSFSSLGNDSTTRPDRIAFKMAANKKSRHASGGHKWPIFGFNRRRRRRSEKKVPKLSGISSSADKINFVIFAILLKAIHLEEPLLRNSRMSIFFIYFVAIAIGFTSCASHVSLPAQRQPPLVSTLPGSLNM